MRLPESTCTLSFNRDGNGDEHRHDGVRLYELSGGGSIAYGCRSILGCNHAACTTCVLGPCSELTRGKGDSGENPVLDLGGARVEAEDGGSVRVALSMEWSMPLGNGDDGLSGAITAVHMGRRPVMMAIAAHTAGGWDG
ncbi:hypothetical protein GUJ93_ZPchr0008g12997 [Zizania palustris]|uniref:Uncharacterized protein n=1 Tax=Zizania palustris TaxID=103762 RepID=A0A8J5V1U4_ZIZPA|nr:hypothetical protein GUJ93_ZPchr0008g12997 [Zizania palustris]